ncbi:hypothetical protein PR202_ga18917 [Eleusine coracana subsp. coracana]|uniref:non-specific serine/threonine protein kinase n=1 Tax=Eleusine coracana subsp. coracana TaxID=191504 RepID=A0AAV5CT38_ELECO|nr:hypothetical protein PR202_ga18917 [Eleusine coracana subsp. coracana]
MTSYHLRMKPLVFPDDKLISNNGFFALGLFSPTNSSTRFYVGIWYNTHPERTVVWVANRDNPIINHLVINPRAEASATLLLNDDGNLVLGSSNGTMLWQVNFDNPTDTLLPGGDLSSGLQYMIWNRSNPFWRSRAWCSPPTSSTTRARSSSTIVSQGGRDFAELQRSRSMHASLGMHARLSYAGMYEFRIWNSTTSASGWTVLVVEPESGCDRYALCGPFSYCKCRRDV